ncbi:MAG: Phenylacetate-coenzyme A ligase [Syntrophorhabdus sp. PtaU1.Bin058]|nr:MAG: Phenylacetate-coenzyme A ligase [Syntrophorhabdus sp. PtaU1.Bin058]
MVKVKMWRPEIETLPREELEKRQLKYFRKQMKYVIENSPFYKRKFKAAGVTPNDVKTMDDVRQVPFTTKQELLQSQEEHPIFGDFPCIKPEEATRVFQTSGTTGKPLKIPFSKKDWFKTFYEQFSYYVYAYGMEKKDVAFFPFTYGTFIAWWGIQSVMEQHEITIVPGGGQSSDARVKSIADWNATIVCGTPTYVIYLGELAQKMGIDLPNSKVRIVVTAGEPGAQVPATKQLVEKLYGAKNYDDIGSTEITNFGFECVAQKGTHMSEGMFLPESLDTETGKPAAEGETGELVLSNLFCESAPLLRYKTKDLVRFNYKKCSCGRTFLRMEGGVLGRADDMFTFGGVNIFPSAIENFIRGIPTFSNEYQLVIPKQGSGKRMKIKVEPASTDVSNEQVKNAVKQLSENIVYNIKVTADIELVDPGSLPRFEGKAKRVIKES